MRFRRRRRNALLPRFLRASPESVVGIALILFVCLLAGTAVAGSPEVSGTRALLDAADRGDVALARKLLDSQADVNAGDAEGWTALHAAALAGHRAIAELLLDRGANVNAAAEDGVTPLMAATHNGHLEI